jgi:hypothetical protein
MLQFGAYLTIVLYDFKTFIVQATERNKLKVIKDAKPPTDVEMICSFDYLLGMFWL